MKVLSQNSIAETEIILPFRGDRLYVHSASFINTIMPIADSAISLTVRFSRMTSHNRLLIVHLEPDADTPPDVLFDAWWDGRDGRGKLVAYETGNAVPDLCVPYPENEAIDGWQLSEHKALLQSGAGRGYTLIDRLVALNKAYLTKLFPVIQGERFIATRFDLKGNTPALAALSLEHVRRIGPHHHVTRITANGDDAGLIYFASQKL
jgi:hypothetical protein